MQRPRGGSQTGCFRNDKKEVCDVVQIVVNLRAFDLFQAGRFYSSAGDSHHVHRQD